MTTTPGAVRRARALLAVLATTLVGHERVAPPAPPRRADGRRRPRTELGDRGQARLGVAERAETEGDASFGRWLRRRRRALDLTQEGLGRLVACSTVMIRLIEADERRPSRELAARLAEQLQLAPADYGTFIRSARGLRRVDTLGSPAAAVLWPPVPPAATQRWGTRP